jgi:hypothetical protein
MTTPSDMSSPTTTTIKHLLEENMVQVLCFLRASDLASCREVDKSIFSAMRISRAVEAQLALLYDLPIPPHLRKKTVADDALKRPDLLYVAEITSITFCLSAPQPCAGKGTLVSPHPLNPPFPT